MWHLSTDWQKNTKIIKKKNNNERQWTELWFSLKQAKLRKVLPLYLVAVVGRVCSQKEASGHTEAAA